MMLSLLFALALKTVQVDVVNLPLDKDVNIMLAPAGKAELKRDGTVTRVKVELERLQPPTALGPVLSTYVVWAVSPEGILENLGEVNVNGNKGQLNATTRLGQLGLLITAEPHYMVDRPSSGVAYRSDTPREEVRHQAVPVEVGAYDYSALIRTSAIGVHVSVLQARVAVQIAQNAGADRLAEPEFRSAKVALASVEELVARAAPLDILWPSANEAIRWSQRAVTVARERETLAALQSAKTELDEANLEKRGLESRIRELNEQQTSSALQIQTMRSALSSITREKDDLTAQRDLAESRSHDAERELGQLQQKQEELQKNLNVTLRSEFFDSGGLTEAGRDALHRVLNIAEVVSGPIRLGGNVPDAAVKAAIEFLLLAGIPQERIITKR